MQHGTDSLTVLPKGANVCLTDLEHELPQAIANVDSNVRRVLERVEREGDVG